VEDGALERNVAEVAGASLHATFAGEAATVLVHDAHARVVDRMEVGLKSGLVVDEGAVDFSDGEFANQVWGHDSKLECSYLVLVQVRIVELVVTSVASKRHLASLLLLSLINI
jgi:hypothetical protein